MQKNSVLYLTLVCAVIGAVLYVLADTFYLYWAFWWYDVLMHFFIGLTGGLGLYWGLFHSGLIFKTTPAPAFAILSVLLAVLVFGIAWEIFEYANGMTDSSEGYHLDTVNDLVLDSCGAVLAALIASRKKNNG